MVSTSLLEVISDEKVPGYRGMEEMQETGFSSRSVQCRCPKCGKTHFLKFFWTGTGIPRKYCHRCRESISGISDASICSMGADSPRAACSGAAIE